MAASDILLTDSEVRVTGQMIAESIKTEEVIVESIETNVITANAIHARDSEGNPIAVHVPRIDSDLHHAGRMVPALLGEGPNRSLVIDCKKIVRGVLSDARDIIDFQDDCIVLNPEGNLEGGVRVNGKAAFGAITIQEDKIKIASNRSPTVTIEDAKIRVFEPAPLALPKSVLKKTLKGRETHIGGSKAERSISHLGDINPGIMKLVTVAPKGMEILPDDIKFVNWNVDNPPMVGYPSGRVGPARTLREVLNGTLALIASLQKRIAKLEEKGANG